MTDDLLAFIRARYDERERAGLAATPGPWKPDAAPDGRWYVDPGHDADDVGEVARLADAEHIALNDPAWVLAEVDAKRCILDELIALDGDPVNGLAITRMFRLLALPYAGHPDYRDEWKP